MMRINKGTGASLPPRTEATLKKKRPKQKEHIRRLKGHALFRAAKENNLGKVRTLLKEGAYLGACENDYCALHWAVHHKNIEMVKLLIRYDANPMIRTINGLTPIQIAVKNDSGSLLHCLIEKTLQDKTDYQRNDIYKQLSEMTVNNKNVIIAFANYLFNKSSTLTFDSSNATWSLKRKHSVSYVDVTAIDIPLLLHYAFLTAAKTTHSHQPLCYKIASCLMKLTNRHDEAILFLTLAGTYKDAEQLKARCYTKLIKPPLKEANDTNAVKSVLTHLIHLLKKGYSENAFINNELGMIYEVLGNTNQAYQYYKHAAWLGSLESLTRLSHFAKHMPNNKVVLAKYKAMCYHLGAGDKIKNDKLAMKYLDKAIRDDKEETLSYLKRQGKSFSYTLLTDNTLLEQLNFDFAISLFNINVIRKKLSEEEKVNFLLYCAQRHPTHNWVRKHPFTIYTLQQVEKSLSEDLANTYIIMTLLNGDRLPEQAKQYIKPLAALSQEGLVNLCAKFFDTYEPERMDHVCHITQLYQTIVTANDASSEHMATTVDLQDYRQLVHLLEVNQGNSGRNKIKNTVQQVALRELSEAFKNGENSKQDEEKIKCAMKDPLFKNHHTFFFNPIRLCRTKAFNELKKLLKEERDIPKLN
jgi:hypothetical protein